MHLYNRYLVSEYSRAFIWQNQKEKTATKNTETEQQGENLREQISKEILVKKASFNEGILNENLISEYNRILGKLKDGRNITKVSHTNREGLVIRNVDGERIGKLQEGQEISIALESTIQIMKLGDKKIAYPFVKIDYNSKEAFVAAPYLDIFNEKYLDKIASTKDSLDEEFSKGLQAYKENNFTEAFFILESIPQPSKMYATANYYLGLMVENKQVKVNQELSPKYFENVSFNSEYYSESQFLLGTHYFNRQLYSRATKYLSRVDYHNKYYSEAQYFLGTIYLSLNGFKQRVAEHFSRVRPESGFKYLNAQYHLGVLQLEKGNTESAIAYFNLLESDTHLAQLAQAKLKESSLS